ncbi:methylthioribulose 1-phosphate dehydratase [Streptomyces sp. NPDC052020]|uniref:methylthioribulose 1-phosphate dehydratase n=1 Tax=Streptomyces sp. NPDC052020 TaxID=3155677 RepID=UPI00342141B6
MKPVSVAENTEMMRTDLARTCRRLYGQGWMPGTSGNVSVRSAKAVLVTATGRGKGTIGPADTVLVDPRGGSPLTGESEWPSAETAIHLAVYRACPEARAVVHSHAPYATALATVTGPARHVVFRDLELAKGLGVSDPAVLSVPVFANHADVREIAEEVGAHLSRPTETVPALFIDRHGVTVWGGDLEQANNRLECVEALCRLVLLTRRPGAVLAEE